MKRKLLICLLASVTLLTMVQSSFASEDKLPRLAGSNRYLTAVAISQDGWEQSDTVVLSRADGYADALAGVPLAYAYDAPILITRTNVLNEDTKAEIERLGATNIIILGDESAVSEDIEKNLQSEGLVVDRISGNNRYETSTKIARHLAKVLEVDSFDSAVMVYGQNFPDALSVAGHAARLGQPILLTNGNQVHSSVEKTMADLQIENITIIGGESMVSEAIKTERSATRVAGSNRYLASLEVTKHF